MLQHFRRANSKRVVLTRQVRHFANELVVVQVVDHEDRWPHVGGDVLGFLALFVIFVVLFVLCAPSEFVFPTIFFLIFTAFFICIFFPDVDGVLPDFP